jgi:hypothetical protein
MITPAHHNAAVIWQDPDDAQHLPESAVLVHRNTEGTILVEQEGRTVCLNTSGARDLIAKLRQLLKEHR